MYEGLGHLMPSIRMHQKGRQQTDAKEIFYLKDSDFLNISCHVLCVVLLCLLVMVYTCLFLLPFYVFKLQVCE